MYGLDNIWKSGIWGCKFALQQRIELTDINQFLAAGDTSVLVILGSTVYQKSSSRSECFVGDRLMFSSRSRCVVPGRLSSLLLLRRRKHLLASSVSAVRWLRRGQTALHRSVLHNHLYCCLWAQQINKSSWLFISRFWLLGNCNFFITELQDMNTELQEKSQNCEI